MQFKNINKDEIWQEIEVANKSLYVADRECVDTLKAIKGTCEDGLVVNFNGIDKKIINKLKRMLPIGCTSNEDVHKAFALYVFYLMANHYTDNMWDCPFISDFISRYMNNLVLVTKESLEKEDAWFNNITIPTKGKSKGWEYVDMGYNSGEFFINECPDCIDYASRENLGVAIGNIPYTFVVNEEIGVSYDVSPFVINESSYGLKEATGNVLVLGLKAGYFTYMAHLKDDVKKVTVIENEKGLINLFKKHILPQCDNPDKIEIINASPIDYISNDQNLYNVDYVWCDLYSEGTCGVEVYQRVKAIEVTNDIKFGYYDEWNVLLEIREYIATELALQVLEDDDDGVDEDDFEGFDDGTDSLDVDSTDMSYVVSKVQNIPLESDEDINNLMDIMFIKDILSKK